MRRKVKFQGVVSDEAADDNSVSLNSLLDRSINSRNQSPHEQQGLAVFSESHDENESDQASHAWTLTSLDHDRRLYGRSKDRGLLRQAYTRLWETGDAKPTIQLALISGKAGCGKTSLASSIKQSVLDDGGFFLRGKFDQMQGTHLYSAFVAAFSDLVDDVVERGPTAVKSMKRAIQGAVHTEERILTDMIPSLEKILGPGKKDMAKEFRQSSDEISCFKFVFRMFVRAISSPEYPIILFLDDLHFADEASLDLLRSLVTDTSNDGVLYIGTYRQTAGEEDKIGEFLSNKNQLPITHIPIANLSARAVDEMVAEIFSVVNPGQIKPLTDIIFHQTQGNVFYIREFLRYLQEEGLLIFDEMGMEWVWDERKIHQKIDFRKPLELMTVRISRLPRATREVLEVAACLGSTLDEKLLNRISPRPVFSQLQRAASRGFLSYNEEADSYRFSHDIVQEAAYKLISYQERQAFHLAIGRELWKSFDDIEDLERHIFIILGQIREGADLITYQEERNDVAALCLRAGELAICSSSFQTASEFLLLGVSLLGQPCWRDEYELSLELYNAAAEVEYCVGNFDTVEKLASEIFRNARWFPDTLRAHSIHVYSLGSRGHMLKAIERGLQVLESLGEKFPSRQSPNTIAAAIKKTKWLMKGKSIDRLLRLPLMDNPEKIAAMQMMNIMFLYAYIAVPSLAPLIATRMVKLSLEYGLSDVSSVGFVTYAMLLCGGGNDIDEAFKCGDLALQLYEKFGNKSWLGRVSAWFYGSVFLWKKPIRAIFEPIKAAHRVALETGDIDFAMLNANVYCWESFDITTLTKLERIVKGFANRMDAYGQESVLMMIKPIWQMVHNLMGHAHGDPTILTGEVMDQEYSLQYARENNKSLLVWIHFYRMFLCYILGDYESAEVHASVCRAAENNPFGTSDRVLFTFYDGLVALAHKKKTRARLQQARRCIKTFKTWAKHCPENFLGKVYFLEAELAAVTGDDDRAHSKFTSAISLSREGGYIMQHALANERAGKYFLQRGDVASARIYFKESVSVYKKWGGKLKMDHLKSEVGLVVDIGASSI